MSDWDRYVKTMQDLLGQLPSPAERLRAIEQVVTRLSGFDQPRQSAQAFLHELPAMPEHLRELQGLLRELGSPGERLRDFEKQLSTTRKQLQLMAEEIADAERMVGRMAGVAEQFAALTEPFTKAAEAWSDLLGGAGGAGDAAGTDTEGDDNTE